MCTSGEWYRMCNENEICIRKADKDVACALPFAVEKYVVENKVLMICYQEFGNPKSDYEICFKGQSCIKNSKTDTFHCKDKDEIMVITNDQFCLNRGEKKCKCFSDDYNTSIECETAAKCTINSENKPKCKNDDFEYYECSPEDFCSCSQNPIKKESSPNDKKTLCQIDTRIFRIFGIFENSYTEYHSDLDEKILTNKKKIERIPREVFYLSDIPELQKKTQEEEKLKKSLLV